ncbi:hypothetical protein [Phycobacter azelaicus]|uniref:hypothetical protein n=1 Tax=Phycobacter azelaicus TaxID=2668075 RepID=UPI00186686D4|nr:hypothetical protein [Phycobacter azelaicus]MBE1297378.1 hypothetical protein [Paracoccaceae bacterium]
MEKSVVAPQLLSNRIALETPVGDLNELTNVFSHIPVAVDSQTIQAMPPAKISPIAIDLNIICKPNKTLGIETVATMLLATSAKIPRSASPRVDAVGTN